STYKRNVSARRVTCYLFTLERKPGLGRRISPLSRQDCGCGFVANNFALRSLAFSSQATSDVSSANRLIPTSRIAESGTTFSGVCRGWWLSLYGSFLAAL